METKICKKCKKEKYLNCFWKKKNVKSGLVARCSDCLKEEGRIKYIENKDKRSQYGKAYRDKNKEILFQRNKRWRDKNKAHVKEKYREWYYSNRSRAIAYSCEYSKKNNIKRNIRCLKRARERRETDFFYKFKSNLRTRIYFALTDRRLNKNETSKEILGAEYDVVKKHIERQFKKGMNWNNYGKGDGKWHIDHIIPLAFAKTEEEVIGLCHYTNLQPLWGKENMSKGKNILNPIQIKMTI